jgi:hypothetical protein
MKTVTNSIIEAPSDNHDKLLSLFDSPKLIGVVGDANSGKSNMLYFIIKALRAKHNFSLYTYGMRVNLVGEQKIYSVERLETIQNSIILIDEFASLFDLDDRKEKKQVEHTLRLIFHNNNVVLFCGLPENYKKFIAAKLGAMIFKKCALSDFINGSRVKSVAFNCEIDEKGAAMFAIPTDQAIVYDGLDYHKVQIPYLPESDTKAKNTSILR